MKLYELSNSSRNLLNSKGDVISDLMNESPGMIIVYKNPANTNDQLAYSIEQLYQMRHRVVPKVIEPPRRH